MKKIAFFCIPAYGHMNPMLPVAKELVKQGHQVRFYSFKEFTDKINNTGAEFISCDQFLPSLSEYENRRLKNASSSEMIIQDLKITFKIDSFLNKEFTEFKPNVVFVDSVCFWGKLSALKHNVPMIVSNSTLAFNEYSSKYLKQSFKEITNMLFGWANINKELKSLKEIGYNIKSPLDLFKNDNNTNTVVYTSKSFQPLSETFSDKYLFVGPSLDTSLKPDKKKDRPLVYISMGTVVNNQLEFYQNCIEALKDLNLDVIISIGNQVDPNSLRNNSENIKVFPYVNQLEVLSKADVFVTHSGMNSVSESVYFQTPMVLFPQTSEEWAVATRVEELGAGTLLKNISSRALRECINEILNNGNYNKIVRKLSNDFKSCPGPVGAAEFITRNSYK